jgi:hypothetical protein
MPVVATPNLAPEFKNMNPADGDVLVYDLSTYSWIPGTLRTSAYRIGSNAINAASTNTTSEEILHTWTISANELPSTGRLRVQFFVETNNNANNKISYSQNLPITITHARYNCCLLPTFLVYPR